MRLVHLTPLVLVLAGCGPAKPSSAEVTPPPVAVTTTSVPTVPQSTAKADDAAALGVALAGLDDPRRHGGEDAVTWSLAGPWEANLGIAEVAKAGGVVAWMRPSKPDVVLDIQVAITGARPLSGKMVLAGSGWRRVWIPARALKEVKEAATDQAALRLHVKDPVPEGVSVAIAGVRAVADAKTVTGPSLDEAGLLAAIDWSQPGLAAPRERLAAGDQPGALKALVAVMRKRMATWSFPESEGDPKAADKILAGEVVGLGLTHVFPGGTIDWLANPTTGAQASNEWVWGLNRHMTWWTVANAYRSTKQPEYARGWARLMRSWTGQVAVPAVQNEGPGSVWRDLEAGLRLNRTWFDSLYAVAQDAAVTDDDVLTFARSVWDHGTYLSVCTFNPTNHFIIGQTGLYNAGSQFLEFRDAARWRTVAGAYLQRSLAISTLPEGGWYELAPGYGSWVASKCLDAWDFADVTGQTQELPPELRGKLQRMAEWGVHLVSPDGTVPMVNDGGALTFTTMNLARATRRFPDSPLLTWARATSTGATATPPAWTSERMPDSGYVAMRTGWGRQDSYLLLDTGPMGGWHGHQDALNLVAWFRGRYFLFDNGGYKYDSSIWRKWGPTTAAHNTVLVDGMGQLRTWNGTEDAIGALPPEQPPALFGTSPEADYASGWYVCGYGTKIPNRGKAFNRVNPSPATHRREVLFLKSLPLPVAIVVDTMTPADGVAHAYEVRWHLKTTKWTTADGGAVAWTTDAGKPNLAVISVGGQDQHQADSGVTKPEILGWWFEGQTAVPAPALTLRRQRQTTGVTKLLTVLAAVDGDPTANPLQHLEPSGDGVWRLSLRGLEHPLTIRVTDAGRSPSVAVDGVTLPLRP